VNVATLRLVEPDSGPSDGELIASTLAGDEAAYGALVERFQKRIFRVAFAIVRDEMEADLVTQDTFVQAYMNLARFEARSCFETWLTRIAINRSRDSLRGRRWIPFGRPDDTGPNETVFEPVDERPDAEREAMSRQIQHAIERAERTLSAQQRIIFRLRHYEQLPLEEIAVSLGLQAGTVRAHLFRAIRKVRHELRGWLDFGRNAGGES
jgi:RNA polymerase sigma-70 factor (ECF subfamily)